MFDRKAYMKEYSKKYRNENREGLSLQKKKYYTENAESDHIRCARYREEHKEKIISDKKEYYQKNKEKILLHIKKYKENNRETVRATKRNYKYKRALQLKETDITKDFLLSLSKTSVSCEICGVGMIGAHGYKNSKQLDHIVPLNVGGKHERNNVRYICATCNNMRPMNGKDHYTVEILYKEIRVNDLMKIRGAYGLRN